VKNFYSLNAGEFFVAQALLEKRRDLELYYPLKDTGVDLLAVRRDGGKPVRIQVKESRVYEGKSWHQVRKDKIGDADVFVFVSYIEGRRGRSAGFGKDFVVIPQSALRKMCSRKKCSQGKYSFYCQVQGDGRLCDVRDGCADLSPHHNAWQLI
jgi:hypothetical protein